MFAYAERLQPEKNYQIPWCQKVNGQWEVPLDDMTRIDCLFDDPYSNGKIAAEFDFTDKWAEAVGQSLFYAAKTNNRPGVILIVEKITKPTLLHVTRLLKIAPDNMSIWLMFSDMTSIQVK